jgi:hypothetical protein
MGNLEGCPYKRSTMYCWKCGAVVEEVAIFCSKCGANVRKVAKPAEVSFPAAQASSRESKLAESDTKPELSPTGPSGIGGWLAWFAFSLSVLAPLRTIGVIADMMAIVPAGKLVPAIEIGLAALGVYALVTGILIFAKRPNAIYDAKTFLIVALCLNVVTSIFVLARTQNGTALILPIWSLAYFVIWWQYLSRSVRVKNTFPRID